MEAYEQPLAQRLIDGLSSLPGLRIYGPPAGHPRTSTVSFTLAGHPAPEIARTLGEQGLFVWDGDFYAARVIELAGIADSGGLLRIGLCPYNTGGRGRARARRRGGAGHRRVTEMTGTASDDPHRQARPARLRQRGTRVLRAGRPRARVAGGRRSARAGDRRRHPPRRVRRPGRRRAAGAAGASRGGRRPAARRRRCRPPSCCAPPAPTSSSRRRSWRTTARRSPPGTSRRPSGSAWTPSPSTRGRWPGSTGVCRRWRRSSAAAGGSRARWPTACRSSACWTTACVPAACSASTPSSTPPATSSSRRWARAAPFDEALAQVQAEGYAEADPSHDIDGVDGACKTAALANVAMGAGITPADIPHDSIRGITPEQVRAAQAAGRRLCVLCSARRVERRAAGDGAASRPARAPQRPRRSLRPPHRDPARPPAGAGAELVAGRGAAHRPHGRRGDLRDGGAGAADGVRACTRTCWRSARRLADTARASAGPQSERDRGRGPVAPSPGLRRPRTAGSTAASVRPTPTSWCARGRSLSTIRPSRTANVANCDVVTPATASGPSEDRHRQEHEPADLERAGDGHSGRSAARQGTSAELSSAYGRMTRTTSDAA